MLTAARLFAGARDRRGFAASDRRGGGQRQQLGGASRFGSKDLLIQAIFEYRLPLLHERRTLLIAARRPADLRGGSSVGFLRPWSRASGITALPPLPCDAPASMAVETSSIASAKSSWNLRGPSMSGLGELLPQVPCMKNYEPLGGVARADSLRTLTVAGPRHGLLLLVGGGVQGPAWPLDELPGPPVLRHPPELIVVVALVVGQAPHEPGNGPDRFRSSAQRCRLHVADSASGLNTDRKSSQLHRSTA